MMLFTDVKENGDIIFSTQVPGSNVKTQQNQEGKQQKQLMYENMKVLVWLNISGMTSR